MAHVSRRINPLPPHGFHLSRNPIISSGSSGRADSHSPFFCEYGGCRQGENPQCWNSFFEWNLVFRRYIVVLLAVVANVYMRNLKIFFQ